MEHQIKESPDEITIFDLWKVIANRRRLIIGIFLTIVISTAIINFLMPKIYRGTAVMSIWQNEAASISMTTTKIPPKEGISANEMAEIIGNVDNEKRLKILPKTHDSVTDIKFNPFKDSKNKLTVIIDAKNSDDIAVALAELLDYINNLDSVKLTVKEEREKLVRQLSDLSEIIRSSSELAGTYHRLLKDGKLLTVGFNPIDLDKKIADMKIEKLIVEQTLQRIQNGGLATASQLYVSKKPVKPRKLLNMVSAGVASLFIGVFLALFLEFVERIKGNSTA